jgi:hypothetical protein
VLTHTRVTSWDPAGSGVPLEALVAADPALRHPHLVTTHAWTLVTQPVSGKNVTTASEATDATETCTVCKTCFEHVQAPCAMMQHQLMIGCNTARQEVCTSKAHSPS